jgi:hypothetical protein
MLQQLSAESGDRLYFLTIAKSLTGRWILADKLVLKLAIVSASAKLCISYLVSIATLNPRSKNYFHGTNLMPTIEFN